MPKGAGVVEGDEAAVVPGVDVSSGQEQEVDHLPAAKPWRERGQLVHTVSSSSSSAIDPPRASNHA